MTATTDSFGDEMRFVESYGDFLPQSENIETAEVIDGISGISHDGDIYCLDCAVEMELIVQENNNWKALVDGDAKEFNKAPWTGIVEPRFETMTQYHCGCGRDCCNALSGEEHPYNHDLPVGIGIKQQILEH